MSSIAISMSIEKAEAKYSDKFVKDLEKLIVWMGQNDWTLTDVVTGDSIEWNESLIDFEEPGRNKLESYVKELSKYYTLAKNGEEIDDIKTMIKEFRENKPKRINKQKETNKNEIKGQKDILIQKDILKNIIVKNNDEINTEQACYIETLDFSTEELVKVLGEPLKNGSENDKHQYEWKIVIITESGKEDIYSIYNWMDKTGNFKEFLNTEWHLATMRTCPKKNFEGCECQLEEIIEFISKKLETIKKNDEIDKNEGGEMEGFNEIQKSDEKEIKINNEIQENDKIKKIFNLTDNEDNLIDIDDIHF